MGKLFLHFWEPKIVREVEADVERAELTGLECSQGSLNLVTISSICPIVKVGCVLLELGF